MQKVLTAEQMREVDRLTTEKYGIPSILLMENAAHAVARVITEKLGGSVEGRSILVLCGTGNNGGDGAAVGRLLWQQGASVAVELFGKIIDTKGDARANFEILQAIVGGGAWGGSLWFREQSLDLEDNGFDDSLNQSNFDHSDVVVDALFGTGLTRRLEGFHELLTGTLRNWKGSGRERPYVISLDIPSGLSADAGEPIGTNIDAHSTVTFAAPKAGNVLAPASRFNGELVVAEIGSPKVLIDEQASQLMVAEASDAADWLAATKFADDSYKNKRGHALLIAGSVDYAGAAVLCGNAAIRSGAGLVTLAVPASCKAEIASRLLPEVILRALAENKQGEVAATAIAESTEMLEAADAIAVGCGLSANDKGVERLVHEIVSTRQKPVIVDAGALWFFSPFPDGVRSPHVSKGPDAADASRGFPLILTPHEGEFLRLLGTKDKVALKDRVVVVREFAVKNNVILVLKGERVLIGEPGGKVVVNPTGNSGLGKAGNGDTLAGILGGFLAQAARFEIDVFETVVAAVYVAGMAGDIAEAKYGKRVMTASDVRECLVEVFAELS